MVTLNICGERTANAARSRPDFGEFVWTGRFAEVINFVLEIFQKFASKVEKIAKKSYKPPKNCMQNNNSPLVLNNTLLLDIHHINVPLPFFWTVFKVVTICTNPECSSWRFFKGS